MTNCSPLLVQYHWAFLMDSHVSQMRPVFPRRRKSKADDDIITKQYVMNTGIFHFGPLLCGKSRDWYKAKHFPSNCEKITILNITPLEAEVHFSFEHDLKADTFLLDPPSMRLKANEKQVGDRQVGRDSKTLVLQNRTPLPVAWRLSGLEKLSEDFSVLQEEGIVGPHMEFGMHLYFKATQALSIKKMIRLEVQLLFHPKMEMAIEDKPILHCRAHFTLGVFTVYPGSGSIPPVGQQVIMVDCYTKGLGTCKEHLSIDISDRDPKDNPLGIPYMLFAESCLPAFVVDVESIFEEHRICSNINLCHILQTVQDKGVFTTDENKFIFTNVLAGHWATARFKIHSVDKVPCDGVLSIKPIHDKLMIDLLDEGGVFFLKARPTTHCIYQAAGMEEDDPGEERKPHTASLVLHHGESAEFDVLFKPTLAQRVEGRIHLSVVDNPYEETNIQLVGEGYEDDFMLDNIHELMANSKENTEGNMKEDIIEEHQQSETFLVIETDPEPAHTVLEKSIREVELRLSAVVDYAEFKLKTDMIEFKEILLFQTRMFT
ncbi:unnamed protein product [Bubo scandiacus]